MGEVDAMINREAAIAPLAKLQPLQSKVFILLLIALLLGIGFRFYSLDRKIFWGDEVFTAMRAAGYTAAEVVDRTYTGEPLSLVELHRYQHPSAERPFQDTLDALEGSPEHSPLYYLLARVWMQVFDGDWAANFSTETIARSVRVIRSLSAVLSLLVFPCLYWLCLELFESPLVAWVAMAIAAVSPFHVLYAQEARGYSLWTVTILLSSAALLRALRRQTVFSWAVYAAAVALGLYAFLFSGFVAIAHGVYVFGLSGWRWSRTVAAYLSAALVALLLFSPWLRVMIANANRLRENVAHLGQDQPALAQLWLLNLSRILFDFNHGASWINPLVYVSLGLSFYALYWLCRHTPRRIWLFVLTLIGVMGSALIGADLLLGGQRSGIARYPIPCYLGIQLAIAALFAAHLLQRRWRRGLVALCGVGVLSCAIASQADLWWNKGVFKSQHNPEAAELVNRSQQSLVVSDSSIERVMAFSYLLTPNTQFQLVEKPNVPRLRQMSSIFLYQPSTNLRRKLERRQNYRFTSYFDGWLWGADLHPY